MLRELYKILKHVYDLSENAKHKILFTWIFKLCIYEHPGSTLELMHGGWERPCLWVSGTPLTSERWVEGCRLWGIHRIQDRLALPTVLLHTMWTPTRTMSITTSFEFDLDRPIIYVSLLLLTPKVLSLPFDPQDNAFLSWAHSYAVFHNQSNCWVCRVLPSSSVEGFPMVGVSTSRKGLPPSLWIPSTTTIICDASS